MMAGQARASPLAAEEGKAGKENETVREHGGEEPKVIESGDI